MYLTRLGVTHRVAPLQVCHRLCHHQVSPLGRLCHRSIPMDRVSLMIVETVAASKVTVHKVDTQSIVLTKLISPPTRIKTPQILNTTDTATPDHKTKAAKLKTTNQIWMTKISVRSA